MTEREEIARKAWSILLDHEKLAKAAFDIADAILALGYRKRNAVHANIAELARVCNQDMPETHEALIMHTIEIRALARALNGGGE